MVVDGRGGRALRFTVLGPVAVWRGRERLDAGSPQQRALLAVLLLRGGRVATVAELIDAVWGEGPPTTAVAALRTYVPRLRKVLGPDAGIVVSDSGGYALRVDEESVDLGAAERLAGESEGARRRGQIDRARELLLPSL
ncbi:AfsR/SARP family transcriptional regulator [Streptomyces chrestomyceticus]|uniref:AfsR/SARP family transcriptional regulator n=1 Tax=Streptomyces chrestomyceticus TaxID=68185 RepID=UPI0033F771DC